MPPPVILDPSLIDQSSVLFDRRAINDLLPHRFEFALLDGVFSVDEPNRIFTGFHDVRPDAYWTRGHIPGRPLLPGVLMIEVGAQLASVMYTRFFGVGRFLGFAGVDNVKFRGAVQPPARLVVVGKGVEVKQRRVICDVQGFVDATMIFEARITGMPI
jgi:3-hydroxyacyl-[acyl-carrier-protein] dehydratase